MVNKRFAKRKPTPEQVLAGIRSTAQHFADITQADTRAVKTADGLVRYQRTGWPLAGQELLVVEPVYIPTKVAA